jgi:hypothetical protein
VSGRICLQLLSQSRLPDAGIATDQDQLTSAFGRPVTRPAQLIELCRAANEPGTGHPLLSSSYFSGTRLRFSVHRLSGRKDRPVGFMLGHFEELNLTGETLESMPAPIDKTHAGPQTTRLAHHIAHQDLTALGLRRNPSRQRDRRPLQVLPFG